MQVTKNKIRLFLITNFIWFLNDINVNIFAIDAKRKDILILWWCYFIFIFLLLLLYLLKIIFIENKMHWLLISIMWYFLEDNLSKNTENSQ